MMTVNQFLLLQTLIDEDEVLRTCLLSFSCCQSDDFISDDVAVALPADLSLAERCVSTELGRSSLRLLLWH